MRVITLSYYDARRLLRRGSLIGLLVAFPLLAALLRAALPDWRIGLIAAWACPFMCLTLVLAVLHVQRREDAASNFVSSLASSPLSEASLVSSRILTGAALFAAQMLPFLLILSLRF